jgi:hypothetical protein
MVGFRRTRHRRGNYCSWLPHAPISANDVALWSNVRGQVMVVAASADIGETGRRVWRIGRVG